MVRFTRKIKLTLNSISLIVAVVFGTLLTMPYFNSHMLDVLGEYGVNQYSDKIQNEYDLAITNISSNKVEYGEKQLHAWENILKGDRAYVKKRALLLELIKKYKQSNDYVKVIEWSKLWMNEDNRDIAAKAYYYDALQSIPESKNEGKNGLVTLYNQYPNSVPVMKLYFASLLKDRDKSIAYSDISEQIYLRKRWQLFWDTGTGFNKENSTPLKQLLKINNNTWFIQALIPSNTKSLRIDPPPGVYLSISDISMTAHAVLSSIPLNSLKLHDLTNKENKIILSGEDDPYFYFNIIDNHKLIDGKPFEIKITFNSELLDR